MSKEELSEINDSELEEIYGGILPMVAIALTSKWGQRAKEGVNNLAF